MVISNYYTKILYSVSEGVLCHFGKFSNGTSCERVHKHCQSTFGILYILVFLWPNIVMDENPLGKWQ